MSTIGREEGAKQREGKKGERKSGRTGLAAESVPVTIDEGIDLFAEREVELVVVANTA